MESFSVSFTLGKAASEHGANINHNNRKFTASNVDEKRIGDNIYTSSRMFVMPTVSFSIVLCRNITDSRSGGIV